MMVMVKLGSRRIRITIEKNHATLNPLSDAVPRQGSSIWQLCDDPFEIFPYNLRATHGRKKNLGNREQTNVSHYSIIGQMSYNQGFSTVGPGPPII